MLKGKQILENTIKQNNFNVTLDTITYNSAITNKEYLLDTLNQKLADINFAQLNQNMTALSTSGTTNSSENFNQLTNINLTNGTGYLYSIISTDSNTLYAVGYDNNNQPVIIKTTNARQSWTPLLSVGLVN
jgi:hypothetical protein